MLCIKKEYDAVLLDIEMPDMDGFETARKIKLSPVAKISNTFILAFTADVITDAMRNKCTECGLAGFVKKPFAKRELYEALKKAY